LLKSTPLKDDPSLRTFLGWDGKLERESSDAALFEVWLEKIQAAIADRFNQANGVRLQELGGRYKELPPDVIFRILENPGSAGAQQAQDPPSPEGPASAGLLGSNPSATRDQLLSDTLKSAREKLAELLGPDSSRWTWGKLHVVRFRHALDQQPGAKDLFDLGPLPRPGDEYTVNATGTSGASYDQVSGASYREILDTSDWDRSRTVNTPGQSGQPGSPHYSDLVQLWDLGRYFPLLYSREAVEDETTDRLMLEP
jgi:penicillin amidase